MEANEKIARLRLSRTSSVGFITFYKLLEYYGTAEQALKMLPNIARRGGRLSEEEIYPEDKAIRDLEEAEKFGAKIVVYGEEGYPETLSNIDDAPPVLTVLGNMDIFSRPALSIVGSRNSSASGRRVCAEMASAVSDAGFVIVSGLARGIDTVAHSVSAKGGTIAVLASGVDVIYPKENDDLYKSILDKGGAIVSENPLGFEPNARFFPKRNRIISGLSLGVLVIEAAMKSGSLITARTALEQNREVFAIPGSPKDPRAEGTNKLIKDGACMVTSPDDVIQELKNLLGREIPMPRKHSAITLEGDFAFNRSSNDEVKPKANNSDVKTAVLDALSTTPIQIDELIRELGIPASALMSVILELELDGKIERHLGNKISLI